MAFRLPADIPGGQRPTDETLHIEVTVHDWISPSMRPTLVQIAQFKPVALVLSLYRQECRLLTKSNAQLGVHLFSS